MKKLFVSDLDGTLLNNEKEITAYSKEVINSFIKKGGLFSVATARTAGTVINMLKNIDISCPVILMNGAMVYDTEKEKYIKYEVIPRSEFLKICALVHRNDVNGFLYAYDGKRIIAYYEKIGDVTEEFYNQRKNSDKYKKFVYTDNFEKACGEECVYFALMDTYEKLKKVYDGLDDADISKTLYKDIYIDGLYYLEIFATSATKANGVKYLKECYKPDSTVVFGDNLNDLDMFKTADFKVAPENAVDEVKKEADFICRSNDKNGVAEFIKNSMGDL